jgi:hypothetical protein
MIRHAFQALLDIIEVFAFADDIDTTVEADHDHGGAGR